MIRAIATAVLVVALAYLSQACSSAAEPRDAHANCDPDYFGQMARGVVACEQLGDQCAYSRDADTGLGELVPMGSADTHWVCTCGGNAPSQIHLYWCEDLDSSAGL